MNASCCTSPIRINAMQVKNRIVFPAMSTKFAAPDGGVTERMLRYYEERAKGGAGLITIEATSVDDTGNSFSRGLSLADDARIPGLAKLARCVKRHGARLSIQLQHGGRAAQPQASGQAVRLVSSIPGVTPYDDSVVLDEEEIARLTDCWSKAAIRARAAGFDAVEIHGAHGYLISQFFSPFTNRRTDAYGGSLENRMRFALEVCRRVRAALGSDFPILYRMSAVEGLHGGVTLEESVALARRLVEEGIDALHVSVGLRETNFMVSPPGCVEKGWNAPLSRAIREGVKAAVPVIVAGRVADEATAQAIIDRGDADMVAMGRALIADPFLPAKVIAGETEDILRCIGCNEGCVGGSARGTGVSCALNPLAGAEGKYALYPAASPRTVLVIGGGPAGMQAALTAAERGHAVELHERSGQLGGLLNVACKPPYKEELRRVVTWFERRLRLSGVRVRLGSEVTPETAQSLKADAIIVATGSAAVRPGFCRAVKNAVMASELLSGEAASGKTALVIGGGLIGCETAEFLAARGVATTVLEVRPELAKDMESRTRRYLLERLKGYGVRFLTNTRVVEITPEGRVKAAFPSGDEQWLEDFDTLAVAVGYKSENGLAARLEEAGCRCIRVGDCAAVGKILSAIESGFKAGCSIT